MPKVDLPNMTEQQRKYFASVREGLHQATGKSLAEWVAIAAHCPETGTRARLKWFKDTHGLLQNRAMLVLREAFPAAVGWDDADTLKEALWTDASSRAIFDAVEKLALDLPDVIASQRKGFSAWSRKYQFAALRPVRGGMARLGLAVPADAHDALVIAKNEGWSERLKTALMLQSPKDANRKVASLLKAAWTAS